MEVRAIHQAFNSDRKNVDGTAYGCTGAVGAFGGGPSVLSTKLIYHTIRDVAVDLPPVFLLLWRSRERGLYEKRVTRPDSRIVIEGFPRCGNTFAYYAFQLMQPKPVHIGNHMHCVSQFALARRWKVPAILLTRAPRETIVSNFIYDSGLPLTYHLRRYVGFHNSARRFADTLVISDFPETTTAFGRVVMRVNDRFGTRFVPIGDTAEEQNRVLAAIEGTVRWRKEMFSEVTRPNRVAFPSADKDARKAMVEEMLQAPKYRDLLQRAEDAHRALL